MANPFKLPGIRNFNRKIRLPNSESLPSDRKLAQQDELDPEARKKRFRNLAGILGGLKPKS